MSGGLFSPRLLAAWIAAAALTFAASLYFGGGTTRGIDAVGPSSFSRSAIGYAGIVEILRGLHIPVIRSRADRPPPPGAGGVLVVAEPPLDTLALLTERLKVPTALLILPKWQGRASELHRGWLAAAELVPAAVPALVLDRVVPGGQVTRVTATPPWTVDSLGRTPNLATPVQLIRSDRLRPVVGSAQGMLIGELAEKGRRLWVLADPDVLSNYGLARDGNPAFALALFQGLLAGNAVVFDEAIHGYAAPAANPLRLLFRFPFVVATATGALTLLLLLWATLGRFGAPQAPPAALEAGKQGLIANAADLLDFAGYRRDVVRRYVDATLRDAASRLHAPRGLSGAALLQWLQRIGDARGVTRDCTELSRAADGATDVAGATALARAIHQWKGEIIDGASGDPQPRRRSARRGEEGRRRAG